MTIFRHFEHIKYPEEIPFSPDERYPEYLFGDISVSKNSLYKEVRLLFAGLNLDIENFGKSDWNPLGKYIIPGNKVLIKPNWVRHFNPEDNSIESLVTHSSLLRVILDYVIIALKNNGEITIGDAPVQSCNFEELLGKTGIMRVVDFLSKQTKVKIEVIDFRNEIYKSGKFGTYERIINNKNKYYEINLGKNSFLDEIRNDFKKFRVTSYNIEKMLKNHNLENHKYLIIDKVFESDVIIEVPKLKTHHKAGITCCLKNNVGINVSKDYLVHHRKGSIKKGGDAYRDNNLLKYLRENLDEMYNKTGVKIFQFNIKIILKLLKLLSTKFEKDKTFEGSWYGNDTVWRMILDLNNILFFYNSEGKKAQKALRNVIYFVDGITAGQGEGPLKPSAVNLGLIGFGTNPVLIDIVCSKFIGFDFNKINVLKKSLANNFLDFDYKILEMQKLIFNDKKYLIKDLPVLKNFIPPEGWKDNIELKV